MSELDRSAVETVLKEIKDPETGRSLVQMDQVKDIRIDGDQLAVTIGLTTASAPIWNDVVDSVRERLTAKLPSAKQVVVTSTAHDRAPQKLGEIGLTAKHVIAIGSGKGGVGKSTIAASLAFGLKRAGCKVGLMDADVYGPSVPHLLGVADAPRPSIDEQQKIVPIDKDGMPVMSIGFLVPPGEAVVWRGPMLHGAITQFLRDTAWGELDYLIIDMPPGTGDIALTLSQLLPLTGAVVVCTPQDVALLDATKAIAMFQKVGIPVLGMVENMSGFVCPYCNNMHDIFGSGGALHAAEQRGLPFLVEVPINFHIRTNGDDGAVDATFDDPVAGPVLEKLTYSLVRHLASVAAQAPPKPQLPVLG